MSLSALFSSHSWGGQEVVLLANSHTCDKEPYLLQRPICTLMQSWLEVNQSSGGKARDSCSLRSQGQLSEKLVEGHPRTKPKWAMSSSYQGEGWADVLGSQSLECIIVRLFTGNTREPEKKTVLWPRPHLQTHCGTWQGFPYFSGPLFPHLKKWRNCICKGIIRK